MFRRCGRLVTARNRVADDDNNKAQSTPLGLACRTRLTAGFMRLHVWSWPADIRLNGANSFLAKADVTPGAARLLGSEQAQARQCFKMMGVFAEFECAMIPGARGRAHASSEESG